MFNLQGDNLQLRRILQDQLPASRAAEVLDKCAPLPEPEGPAIPQFVGLLKRIEKQICVASFSPCAAPIDSDLKCLEDALMSRQVDFMSRKRQHTGNKGDEPAQSKYRACPPFESFGGEGTDSPKMNAGVSREAPRPRRLSRKPIQPQGQAGGELTRPLGSTGESSYSYANDYGLENVESNGLVAGNQTLDAFDAATFFDVEGMTHDDSYDVLGVLGESNDVGLDPVAPPSPQAFHPPLHNVAFSAAPVPQVHARSERAAPACPPLRPLAPTSSAVPLASLATSSAKPRRVAPRQTSQRVVPLEHLSDSLPDEFSWS